MHRNEQVSQPQNKFTPQQLLEMGHLGRAALPLDRALQNAIWVMTGDCNVACPYCIRSNRTGHEAQNVTNSIIDSLATFPGIWRLSLTGGEVTQVPGFFENIVPRFMETTPHMFSISTNLTAPEQEYENLMATGGERFERMSASFHYSVWPHNVDSFLDKVKDLHQASSQYGLGKFNIACVLAPNALKTILSQIEPFVRKNEIPIYYQILKVPGKDGLPVPFKYNPEQIEMIDQIIGQRDRVQSMNPGFSFTGRQCKAGVNALLIEPNGDAFTCFDQMELQEPRGFLGNVITDGPNVLRNNLVVCAAPFCNVGSSVIDKIIDDPQEVVPDTTKRGQADGSAQTHSIFSPIMNRQGGVNYQQDLRKYLSST